jgi:solute carrier family 25 (mitochondrial aspartate/glutamate transporter), member 12/13
MEKIEELKIMTPLHTFLAGASARCTAAIIMFPVDLIKTRLQFQRESNKMIKTVYKNGFDAFRTILKQEGFLSLYKGKTLVINSKGLPIRLIYVNLKNC